MKASSRSVTHTLTQPPLHSPTPPSSPTTQQNTKKQSTAVYRHTSNTRTKGQKLIAVGEACGLSVRDKSHVVLAWVMFHKDNRNHGVHAQEINDPKFASASEVSLSFSVSEMHQHVAGTSSNQQTTTTTSPSSSSSLPL